jgi:hypothetical protein
MNDERCFRINKKELIYVETTQLHVTKMGGSHYRSTVVSLLRLSYVHEKLWCRGIQLSTTYHTNYSIVRYRSVWCIHCCTYIHTYVCIGHDISRAVWLRDVMNDGIDVLPMMSAKLLWPHDVTYDYSHHNYDRPLSPLWNQKISKIEVKNIRQWKKFIQRKNQTGLEWSLAPSVIFQNCFLQPQYFDNLYNFAGGHYFLSIGEKKILSKSRVFSTKRDCT